MVFRGENSFLSNMYPCRVSVSIRGKDYTFKCAEAAFQAVKCTGSEHLLEPMSGREAKAFGRKFPLTLNWDEIRDEVMYVVVKAKFSQNPSLGLMLCNTVEDVIVEENTWGDTYWGVSGGVGQNTLGKILTQVRAELRSDLAQQKEEISMPKAKLFTVGYSTFGSNGAHIMLETLRQQGVNLLLDVRSVPYSSKYRAYNKETFGQVCAQHGIRYAHVPELGGKFDHSWDVFSPAEQVAPAEKGRFIFPIAKYNRPERTNLEERDLIVDFGKVRTDPRYQRTIRRFRKNFELGDTICLMCMEKWPMDCHRYLIHSEAIQTMYGDTVEIQHITPRGVITNDEIRYGLIEYVNEKFGCHSTGKDEDKLSQLDCALRLSNLLHGWKKY